MTSSTIPSSTLMLDEEMDRLISLCAHIAQMASQIRLVHLSNISYAPENLEECQDTLLSMAEGIEGSAILLESLLPSEQRDLLSMDRPKSTTRLRYTRDELLRLRQNVTVDLSDHIGSLLKQVVDCESNDATDIVRQSWRDIRTILM